MARAVFTPYSAFNELSEGQGILVLRMDDKLGDSVTATGFLRELKAKNKNQKLVVVAGPATAAIYRRLSYIDRVLISKKGILPTLKLFFKLKQCKYNFIINTSHILNPRVIFLASLLSAHKKISFANKTVKLFTHHIEIDFKTEHVTGRYRKVLELLAYTDSNLDYQITLDTESQSAAKQYIDQLRKKARNIIVLNSFSGARLRNFNQKTSTAIVRKLLENPDVLVLSLANFGDHNILSSWIDNSFNGRWINNPNLSSIEMNMALLDQCDLIITPDTAWVHIASALKKKLVAVYRKDDNSEEVNSVIWAPYKTEACVIFAESTAENPDDINNVNTDEIVQAAFKMLGLQLGLK